MTGYDLYYRAMVLLGYVDNKGNILNDQVSDTAVEYINQIGSDLGNFNTVSGLTDEINVSYEFAQAMVYGIAMLIALSFEDGEKNKLFCELYNMKRAAAKSSIHKINDVIPRTEGCVL